ncbi:enoyl-CoA hydratase/isomerase family protein [Nocardioides daejeonensis]|uniref:enoyl-CoA hydratase/isomerase family protein n=1 Tax=Nocardioides daejeonensis TaxID=1046556 RepID=UPI000D748778|nr:enoyl-CoA hydratase/isomerase family protein [Nocardioides daejeonensis]
MTSTDEVTISRTGRVGRITLTRPQALNALNLPMVERIGATLAAWAGEDLRAITIESASDRAFCSGGDIRQVRQNTLDGDPEASDRFFATEYEVNRMLGEYPIPIVSLIGGICMGGGLGISVHGPFRVVTENAAFAMPETKIGFFPDVGGSYFLPRLPGHIGSYLGLTGARIDAADALAIGMATHACAPEALAGVPELLAERDGPIDTVLKELAPDAAPPHAHWRSDLMAHREQIDHCFGASSIDGIRERLRRDGSPWATETLELLAGVSPYSLAVTAELMAWGRERSLADCLAMERAVARHVATTPDFIEGVRAALVDKDRAPVWSEFTGLDPALRPAFRRL